jgi:hypothetical protein
MPPEAARFILSLGFAPTDLKRYKQLASKDQVDLEISERQEVESLVQANTALMLLQAKARLSLQSPRKTAAQARVLGSNPLISPCSPCLCGEA